MLLKGRKNEITICRTGTKSGQGKNKIEHEYEMESNMRIKAVTSKCEDIISTDVDEEVSERKMAGNRKNVHVTC